MTPEIIVGLVAVFISGGALGAAGTLLGQWVLRKVQGDKPERALGGGDFELLRGDLTELSRKVHQVDVRLDFTEQLLGGALPLSRPTLEPEAPSPPSSSADPAPPEPGEFGGNGPDS